MIECITYLISHKLSQWWCYHITSTNNSSTTTTNSSVKKGSLTLTMKHFYSRLHSRRTSFKVVIESMMSASMESAHYNVCVVCVFMCEKEKINSNNNNSTNEDFLRWKSRDSIKLKPVANTCFYLHVDVKSNPSVDICVFQAFDLFMVRVLLFACHFSLSLSNRESLYLSISLFRCLNGQNVEQKQTETADDETKVECSLFIAF